MQATRTYLELSQQSQFKPDGVAFADLAIEQVEQPTPELYRRCYQGVGEAVAQPLLQRGAAGIVLLARFLRA